MPLKWLENNMSLPNFQKSMFQEMRDSVGTKDPLEYFKLLVNVLESLNEQLDDQGQQLVALRSELNRVKTQSALAIQWEPKVAADMMSKQIDLLRADKDTYFQELEDFKKAYTEDRVTQNYHDFCSFWSEILGWHPFLE